MAKTFTARRATWPAYRGRGRRPSRGAWVRPCARHDRGRAVAASAPDRTEAWPGDDRALQAQVWESGVSTTAKLGAPTVTCFLITDPHTRTPLRLIACLKRSAAEADAAYRARWPVEQVPQAAKQLLGAHRQFVFGEDSRQRLAELALVSGSLLMCLAATQPAQPTGFWDRPPQPTAGRLRRQLAELQYSQDWPMLEHIRKKNAVTEHLPKGITAHRRIPSYARASSIPT